MDLTWVNNLKKKCLVEIAEEIFIEWDRTLNVKNLKALIQENLQEDPDLAEELRE